MKKYRRHVFESNYYIKMWIHYYEFNEELNKYQIKDIVFNENVFNLIEAKNNLDTINSAWFGWQLAINEL